MVRPLICSLLILLVRATHAQHTAYADFEVQQPAEPQGGLSALQQFIMVNVQKPFLAQVANVKGIVVLKAVVEPDGHVSNVSVLRSLQPDCDREAVRAFRLFNAWKPARKDGQVVRQTVTYPVQFGKNEPVRYENGVATRFYDASLNTVAATDSSVAYRADVPTDTLGLPIGDLHLFERKGHRWKKKSIIHFAREPYSGPFRRGEAKTLLIHRMPNLSGFGPVYVLDTTGGVLSKYIQGADGTIGYRLDWDKRGMVVRRTQNVNGQTIETNWYSSGQIQSMSVPGTYQGVVQTNEQEQLLAYWDSTGMQRVSEVNGWVTMSVPAVSSRHVNQQTTLTEQGFYEQGLKTGRWTGHYADSSYRYVEVFNKGVLTRGEAVFANRTDTLRYAKPNQEPQFVGGPAAWDQFIKTTSQYPPDVLKGKATAELHVRFEVNVDGKTGKVYLMKGYHQAAFAEAARLIEQSSGRWYPGLVRGRPTKMSVTVPLLFTSKQL